MDVPGIGGLLPLNGSNSISLYQLRKTMGRGMAEVPPHAPDGFRVDEAGRLRSSAGDGVHGYTPEGEILGKIRVGAGVPAAAAQARVTRRYERALSARPPASAAPA